MKGTKIGKTTIFNTLRVRQCRRMISERWETNEGSPVAPAYCQERASRPRCRMWAPGWSLADSLSWRDGVRSSQDTTARVPKSGEERATSRGNPGDLQRGHSSNIQQSTAQGTHGSAEGRRKTGRTDQREQRPRSTRGPAVGLLPGRLENLPVQKTLGTALQRVLPQW